MDTKAIRVALCAQWPETSLVGFHAWNHTKIEKLHEIVLFGDLHPGAKTEDWASSTGDRTDPNRGTSFTRNAERSLRGEPQQDHTDTAMRAEPVRVIDALPDSTQVPEILADFIRKFVPEDQHAACGTALGVIGYISHLRDDLVQANRTLRAQELVLLECRDALDRQTGVMQEQANILVNMREAVAVLAEQVGRVMEVYK